jgi:toxin ParE1/3/4
MRSSGDSRFWQSSLKPGRHAPTSPRELRFLPVGNYLIFHRPIENGVEIARVIHGARDYGPELF